MTGISTLRRRRFPASLSRRPMVRGQGSGIRGQGPANKRRCSLTPRSLTPYACLVVARDRLDGEDHLLVGDFVGAAGETGVAAVHEDRPVILGVAPQRRDERPPLRVVERTEIHRRSPSCENMGQGTPVAAPGPVALNSGLPVPPASGRPRGPPARPGIPPPAGRRPAGGSTGPASHSEGHARRRRDRPKARSPKASAPPPRPPSRQRSRRPAGGRAVQ